MASPARVSPLALPEFHLDIPLLDIAIYSRLLATGVSRGVK